MRKETTFFNDNFEKFYAGGDAVAELDFCEDLKEIFGNKKWVRVKLGDLVFKDISCVGPLFAQSEILDKYNVYGNSLDAVFATITDGSELGYAAGSQMMVGVMDNGKVEYHLLSTKAAEAISGFIGSDCPGYRRASVSRKVERLTEDIETSSDKKEVLFQISSDTTKFDNAHGGSYVAINPAKAVYGIRDILEEKYPDYEFKGGYYSHSVISAKWAFPNQADEILEIYKDYVEKKSPAMDFSDAVPTMVFYTSESGETAATLGAYLEKDGKYRMKIGSIVKSYHKGETKEQDIVDAAGDVFARFRDLVAAMAELINIPIENFVNCILNIGIGVVGINKVHVNKAVEEMKDMYGEKPTDMTANDVFYALQTALFNQRMSGKSDTRCDDIEEALLKLLSPNFSWETHDTSVLDVNTGAE